MSELHLIVLWEFARREESQILEDLARHVNIIHSAILSWPSDPEICFARFYGANLPDAHGKVQTCGGGPFRIVIIRDNAPRYGLVETSRGLEPANLNIFELKTRYREWTGGGHKVHTTNTVAEAEHDIFLLTGHMASDWTNGRPVGNLKVLPGQGGWSSLRELFSVLGHFMPYTVLRNSEMLPDAFDPSLHGDIDLLVENPEVTAHLLGAHKVFPEPHRVHYEITVAGQPIHFDFRFVGDGYYDTAWERRMLERRVAANGIFLLHPEDAFFALIYHAIYQKFEIASDYVAKAASLAKAAGFAWTNYEDALLQLENFLAHNGYVKTRPQDTSVRWNERVVNWHKLASEMTDLSDVKNIHPILLDSMREANPLKTMFFTGILNGRKCFIKHSPVAKSLNVAEWRYSQFFAKKTNAMLFERSLFWHITSDGGSFVITEWIDGETLDALIARQDPLLSQKSEAIIKDLMKILSILEAAKIVHRDIRPANIMVNADGHVKLIDFQFAAPFGDSREDFWFDATPISLANLGADYALGRGHWNDRFSLRKILSELPPSTARDRAMSEIAEGANIPTKVAAFPRKQFDWFVRRRKRLLRKKLASYVSRGLHRKFNRDFSYELAFLDIAVTWHALD